MQIYNNDIKGLQFILWTKKRGFSRVILFLWLLLHLFSCRPSKYLEEGDQLVIRNTIELDTDEKIKDKSSFKYELYSLIQPEPNSKLFGLFRTELWFYYQTNTTADSSKFSRWIQRTIAEPPALYDSSAVATSASNITNLLVNRGFWDAKVIANIKKRGKRKVALTYQVQTNTRHYLDELIYDSPDSTIKQILTQTASSGKLQAGTSVESRLYNEEVRRITQTLRDSGYAFFYTNYIDQLELDTTGGKTKGKIRILPFRQNAPHPRFRVGDIRVFPTYRGGQESFISYTKKEGNTTFLSEDGNYYIDTRLLADNIFLKPGDRYCQSNLSKTNRKLGEMDVFRFISVEPGIDSLRPDVLNFDLRLIPKEKWVVGYNLELNTFANSQSNALIGGSFSLNLRNRNFLKGAEQFQINSGLGIEFSRRLDQNIISSLDGRLQIGLSIPKYTDPLGFYSFLNRLSIISDRKFNAFKEDARTSLSVGYNYVSLIDFYQYGQINTSFGYEFRAGKNTSLAINHVGIDYLEAIAQDTFQSILAKNPFLRNSFESEQFFTGLLLRDITYSWGKEIPSKGQYWLLRNRLEISGWELYAADAFVGLFRNQERGRLSVAGVPLSFFASYEFEGRYSKTFNPEHMMAFRLHTALALPYGQTPEVPYVKQYFVGGPTSLRAWRIREVGPGGYADPIIFDATNTNVFYQTGDFKLEFNAEYRFDLFKFYAQVEGAFFLDAGNVWTTEEDPTRPGSKLSWRRRLDDNGFIIEDHFLNQLAIGTGFGIRVDFSYFLLRLDLGYPIRNFFPDTSEGNKNKYWVHRNLKDLSTSRFNFNLAVGYPF